MDISRPTVLLAAGGTGGHVFPARALADELLLRGYQVEVATDTRGLKYYDGLPTSVSRHIIASGGNTGGIIGKVKAAFGVIQGIIQSIKLVKKLNPIAIVGFGGYPSVPPVLAGQLLGVSTIIHESNAVLGLANKILAHRVDKLALSYPQTSGLSDKVVDKSYFTGNPVRQAIANLSIVPYPSLDDKICIMIFGGSQGAKVFSDVIPLALTGLPIELQKRLKVVQQAIPATLDDVQKIYSNSHVEFEIKPFFDDVPDRIKTAHLFITRSGASTVSEMTAAGRPAIYIPFPRHKDNQQVFNAEQVVNVGGGWMILEKDLTVEHLKELLGDILAEPEKFVSVANQAKKLGIIDSAIRLADLITEFN
jgi:UDP-N-acetylglucosamine--N-acetylmuramyl-(pentapeptide) pyrophosphoryl-undecaprenol N-acetylglucosamine transferase